MRKQTYNSGTNALLLARSLESLVELVLNSRAGSFLLGGCDDDIAVLKLYMLTNKVIVTNDKRLLLLVDCMAGGVRHASKNRAEPFLWNRVQKKRRGGMLKAKKNLVSLLEYVVH